MNQSTLFPGTSPTPVMAHTSVTFAASPSDNPLVARAHGELYGFSTVGSRMYVTRKADTLMPTGRQV